MSYFRIIMQKQLTLNILNVIILTNNTSIVDVKKYLGVFCMKTITKIISLVAIVCLLLTCAACGGNEDDTLTMGTNAAFPPYEYVDDDGNIVGIDAEIAAAVAEKLGKKLEIKDMEFNSLLTAVESGAIDFALAGMTVDEERKKSVDFSDTYATGVQVIIVPENSAIKTNNDLSGKKIGVQSGTTGDSYCTSDYGQDAVKQYNNGALAVAALKNGQVDCVVIDNEPAKNFVKANTGLKILETEYIKEDYAAAIAKDNDELLEDFNKALQKLKEDGTIDKIIDKYIPAE